MALVLLVLVALAIRDAILSAVFAPSTLAVSAIVVVIVAGLLRSRRPLARWLVARRHARPKSA